MFSKVNRFNSKPEGSARAEKIGIKNIPEDSGICMNSGNSNAISSATCIVQNSLSISGSESEQIVSKSTFTYPNKIRTTVEIHQPLSDTSNFYSTPNGIHHEEIDYSTTEGVSSNPSVPEGIQTRLLKYLDEMEIKINNQRNKVQSLRSQLFSSDENIEVSNNPSPTDLEQRIRHLIDMSRFCVKETRDFVILYNKKQEQNCAVRPQEYEDLVRFCTDLIDEVSTKLNHTEEKKKWKKVRNFFKSTLRLFKF